MIIRTATGGDLELRYAPFDSGASTIWPRPGSVYYSISGQIVDDETATGLPAVGSVIRSPAEVIASLPFIIYDDDSRLRNETVWQWELLHEKPSEYCDTYRFFYDLALSLEGFQNAFVLKAKSRQRVESLRVLNPQQMRATVSRDGTPVYEYYDDTGARIQIPYDQILHVRGSTPVPGGFNGVSLVSQHRDAIGAYAAMQAFEGDYFRNNAQPPFFFTGFANRQQAEDNRAVWNEKHAGAGNQWKPGFLHGQADVKSLPISMEDALFVDAKRLSIMDCCMIWNWPKELLGLTGEQTTANEDAWTARVLKLNVLPRLRRIERAFAADPDLFYGQTVFGEFLTAALQRPDVVSRFRAYKDAIQGGFMTPNEVREAENLPLHPDGDQLQFPVVGGGPTNAPSSESSPNGAMARTLDLEALVN